MVVARHPFGLSALAQHSHGRGGLRIQQQKLDKAREVAGGNQPKALVAPQPRSVLVSPGQLVAGVEPCPKQKRRFAQLWKWA